MILHIVYDKNGEAVADQKSMEYALSKRNRIYQTDQELQVNVANEMVVHCFRLLVKQGEIKINEIYFYNKDSDPNLTRPIDIDESGSFSYYPKRFLEEHKKILKDLIW